MGAAFVAGIAGTSAGAVVDGRIAGRLGGLSVADAIVAFNGGNRCLSRHHNGRAARLEDLGVLFDGVDVGNQVLQIRRVGGDNGAGGGVKGGAGGHADFDGTPVAGEVVVQTDRAVQDAHRPVGVDDVFGADNDC